MSQKIKARVDTQKSSYSTIGNVNVMDDVMIELQILSNGTVDDPWIEPEFELIAFKQDKNEVRQKDHIDVIDLENHTVNIKLTDQIVTCQGIVKLQLITKNSGRKSTTIFYLNVGRTLDGDIVKSVRDVKVLDDLELYVEKGFKDLNEFEQRMSITEQQLNETNDLMIESEKERESQENERKLSENERKQNEGIRINSERDRVNQEEERKLSENKRSNDETIRIEYERGRITNENKRIEDEVKREVAEGIRESNYERKELERDNKYREAESSRNTDFNQSQTQRTSTFNQSESKRNESFNVAENNRQSSETKRVVAEKTRENSEVSRTSNEEIRQQNETQRINAETERKTSFDELYDRGEKIISDVENATDEIVGARVDYMGNEHETINQAMDSNVVYAVNRAIGEINSVNYEGQRITATNTIEENLTALYKDSKRSAILFGNTMVNEQTKTVVGYNRGIEKIGVNKGVKFKYHELDAMVNFDKFTFKPNTKYILKALYTKNSNVDAVSYIRCNQSDGSNANDFRIDTSSTNNGEIYKIFTTKATVNNILSFRLYLNTNVEVELILDNIRIIEYQDGMENWDIPYFEGMQSSKMPVLSTFGKNLLDYSKFNALVNVNGIMKTVDTRQNSNIVKINASPNTEYTLSFTKVSDICWIGVTINDLNFNNSGSNMTKTFTTDNTGLINIKIGANGGSDIGHEFKDLQLELGTKKTAHEDYKTNILECLEPVELGSVGDVRDSLDGLTGEVIENTIEINVDNLGGVIGVSELTNVLRFNYQIPSKPIGNSLVSCNKLKSILNYNLDEEHIYCGSSELVVFIEKSKIELPYNAVNVKKYLYTAGIRVRYQLAQKVNKTVDLSGDLYSYDSVTHYTCESEEGSLIPTLSIDVPTNLNGLVADQRNKIQSLTIENEELKSEVVVVDNNRESGDLELLSSQWDIDFRLFEIEMAIDVAIINKLKFKEEMSMTRYEQAKTLILGGKYDRPKMEYQLKRYFECGQLTQDEYDELIALMDARELVECK